MKRVELLAPAGDLSKLKIAILYGADAVFVGGKMFSLRAKANNFTIDDLKEAVIFANKHHAKVYVTVNIVPNDNDFNKLDEYLIELDKAGVHAIIVSSLSVILRAQALKCRFEVHVSTQHSIANSKAIELFKNVGVDRVVLAREVPISEMEKIKKETDMPLEVFIHGGMCSSFSGRCTLSNYMASRDANKGGCAHSCRWLYDLYENDKKLCDNKFIIASTDLMSIDAIPSLLDLGIESFKIEGRMKSCHYIATIVSTYRRLIDEYYEKGSISTSRLNYYKKEIAKAENRVTSIGFLKGKMKNEGVLLTTGNELPTQSFIAIVLKEKDSEGYILVEQRNNFKVNDYIDCLTPDGKTIYAKINKIIDLDGNIIDTARHAQEIVRIKINKNLPVDTLIRRK